MRKSRFTEAQIIGVLQEAAGGAAVKEVTRRHGISEQTYYRWKAQYGGLQVDDARRLKALGDENRRLKRIVADQALNLSVLKDALEKRVVTAGQRRAVVTHVQESAAAEGRPVSQRRACRWLGVHRTPIRYMARRPPDTELRGRLRELAAAHPRWAVPRLSWLLRREGRPDNYKRVERLYREEGLTVRKRRRKRVAQARVPRPVPGGPNVRWGIDFVRDTTARGRVFRALTVVDEFTRECLAIEVDTSLPAVRVADALDRIAAARGLPASISVDHVLPSQSRLR